MLRRLPVLVILIVAFVPPLGLGYWQSGGILPQEPGLKAWSDWSPWQQPGPGTRALADGATHLAGVRAGEPPDWMSDNDIATLERAIAALEAGRATAGLGHLLILADRLEAEGRPTGDLLALAAPQIAAFTLAHFFAPVLLAGMILLTALLLTAPMIAKGLAALIRVILGLVVGVFILIAAAWVGVLLMGHPPLVYWAIESLCWATLVLTIGWIGLRIVQRPKKKRLAPPDKPDDKTGGLPSDPAPALARPGGLEMAVQSRAPSTSSAPNNGASGPVS